MANLKEVPGVHRVAALLLSLDERSRAALLSKLRSDVAEKVADAMLAIDERVTDPSALDELKQELARELHRRSAIRAAGEEELGAILQAGLGQAAGTRVLEAILHRRRESRPFHQIESFDPFEVGQILRKESNAVAALVLAYLGPGACAKILSIFEEEQAIDVVKRLAFLEPPSQAVLESVAANLKAQLEATPKVIGRVDPQERFKNVSDVLKEANPEMEKGVIQSVAERDEGAAHDIREYMFTWEDIAGIDTRTMQKILGTVDTKTLSIALKGCSQPVEENLLGNLSARVREMVAEEREIAGALPMSEVLGARDEILKSIRALIEAGEYRPQRGGDDFVE